MLVFASVYPIFHNPPFIIIVAELQLVLSNCGCGISKPSSTSTENLYDFIMHNDIDLIISIVYLFGGLKIDFNRSKIVNDFTSIGKAGVETL